MGRGFDIRNNAAAAYRAAQGCGNFFAIIFDPGGIELSKRGFQAWSMNRIHGAAVAI